MFLVLMGRLNDEIDFSVCKITFIMCFMFGVLLLTPKIYCFFIDVPRCDVSVPPY